MIPGLPYTVLDLQVSSRIAERHGNRSEVYVPHGIYQCAGQGRWCAIAVTSEPQWKELCRIIGRLEWAADPALAIPSGRRTTEDEIDRAVQSWTSSLPAEEVTRILQNSDIAAGVVANCRDLNEDPQLCFRSHYAETEHPEMGPVTHDRAPFRLSLTPGEVRMTAPCLGEHSELVCRSILGISDDQFLELLNAGVFE
jgi:benzylsuccinate CoA-transferase BbsF subunit